MHYLVGAVGAQVGCARLPTSVKWYTIRCVYRMPVLTADRIPAHSNSGGMNLLADIFQSVWKSVLYCIATLILAKLQREV